MILHPNEDTTFLRIYIPGHLRAGAYFVGVLAGYLKYRMKLNNSKIPSLWISIGWIISVLLMFVSLHVGFLFYVFNTPAWFSAIYASLHHVGWSIGIAWFIIVFSSGYAVQANRILSWYPLVILSKLTYTVYLCHGTIQMYSTGTIMQPVYANSFNTIQAIVADIVLAYSLAFILSLLFESPIIGLEKILMGEKRISGNNEIALSTELSTVGT